MTRDEARIAFFAAVEAAIPETVPDWPERRALIRAAGLEFTHVAVEGAVEEYRDLIRRELCIPAD